jgi:putative flavoprotein involved in K+ transport
MHDIVVIGAGQAGLALGYFLQQQHEEFVIVDAGAQIGESWSKRWQSLRLFTPAQFDGLPGFPFPAPRDTFPTKDEMAAYLAAYAARFELPITFERRVQRLRAHDDGYALDTDRGSILARRVVIATGANPVSKRPAFAGQVDPGTLQIHSSEYREPSDLPPGDVLVVGAGTSGVDISLELASTHRVFLSGRLTFRIPSLLLHHAGDLYWWFVSNAVTIRTPIGRKARRKILGGAGAPLLRAGAEELDAAHVERVPRVAGILDGQPQLADDRILPVRSIVWCTGYKPDFSWVDLPVTDSFGWLATESGVCPVAPGVYAVGMPFQYGLTSALIGGVGRDAARIARHLATRHRLAA